MRFLLPFLAGCALALSVAPALAQSSGPEKVLDDCLSGATATTRRPTSTQLSECLRRMVKSLQPYIESEIAKGSADEAKAFEAAKAQLAAEISALQAEKETLLADLQTQIARETQALQKVSVTPRIFHQRFDGTSAELIPGSKGATLCALGMVRIFTKGEQCRVWQDAKGWMWSTNGQPQCEAFCLFLDLNLPS